MQCMSCVGGIRAFFHPLSFPCLISDPLADRSFPTYMSLMAGVWGRDVEAGLEACVKWLLVFLQAFL